MDKGDYMMLAQAIMAVGSINRAAADMHQTSQPKEGREAMDRKVIVALVAKKLWKFLEDFTDEYERSIKLVLDVDSKAFRDYVLDVLVEACQLIKEKKGIK